MTRLAETRSGRSMTNGGSPGSAIVRALKVATTFGVIALACHLVGPAAFATNGETGSTAIGSTTGSVFTALVDADYTEYSSFAPPHAIRSGDVRDDRFQDRGAAVVINTDELLITDSLGDIAAVETGTGNRSLAFAQLNCGLKLDSSVTPPAPRRFCLFGASTAGSYKIKGKRIDVEGGGYAHLLVQDEGCRDGCSASAGADTAFDAEAASGPVHDLNFLLHDTYPQLQPIEWAFEFDVANAGDAGSLAVKLGSDFSAREVLTGALATDVIATAPVAAYNFINSPCWTQTPTGVWFWYRC